MRWSLVCRALLLVLAASTAHAQAPFSGPPAAPVYPQFSNPMIYQHQSPGHWYRDPWTGQYLYRPGRGIAVYQSALDPYRGYADPGSMRPVDRWVWTSTGWARQQGYEWQSGGVPHSNVQQTGPDGRSIGISTFTSRHSGVGAKPAPTPKRQP